MGCTSPTRACCRGRHDAARSRGRLSPDALRGPLSAADLFVLSTRNEGWANVFLEAMACGLPVIATDVGGNAEAVCRPELGTVVPFGDPEALRRTLDEGLRRSWDRDAILAYARDNDWSTRVAVLDREFARLAGSLCNLLANHRQIRLAQRPPTQPLWYLLFHPPLPATIVDAGISSIFLCCVQLNESNN